MKAIHELPHYWTGVAITCGIALAFTWLASLAVARNLLASGPRGRSTRART